MVALINHTNLIATTLLDMQFGPRVREKASENSSA